MPENSLAAFDYAVRIGATALELDLNVTSDEQIVIHHDSRVNTDLCKSSDPVLATQAHPVIYKLTLAQIKTYDCGSIHDTNFPDQAVIPHTPISTLRELLADLNMSPDPHAHDILLNIETKFDTDLSNSPEAKHFVDLIFAVLKKEKFPLHRIILQSFNFDSIVYAKQIRRHLKTSALVQTPADFTQLLSKTRADYLSPSGKLVDAALLRDVHRAGKKILPWTIDSPADWKALVDGGVDGIITDDPEALIKFLDSKK